MYYRAGCAALSVRSIAIPVLAFLRYAFSLRLEDRGRPFRLTHPRTTGP